MTRVLETLMSENVLFLKTNKIGQTTKIVFLNNRFFNNEKNLYNSESLDQSLIDGALK